MKTLSLVVLALTLASAAHAAGPKTYQVTGPVLSIENGIITVQKGKEKWEIAQGSAKVTGDLKVGAKVTIGYTMTADSIEVKGDAAGKTDKPAKKKK